MYNEGFFEQELIKMQEVSQNYNEGFDDIPIDIKIRKRFFLKKRKKEITSIKSLNSFFFFSRREITLMASSKLLQYTVYIGNLSNFIYFL